MERHGFTKRREIPKEYFVWQSMKRRCDNVKSKKFPIYGGRGIVVCDRWKISFVSFIEDMGYRPSPQHSLDRINVNGNYEPNNCRWATAKEQARNTRKNRIIEYNGEVKCMSEWAEQFGINQDRLENRLRVRKWSIHKSLTTPVKHRTLTTQINLEIKNMWGVVPIEDMAKKYKCSVQTIRRGYKLCMGIKTIRQFKNKK